MDNKTLIIIAVVAVVAIAVVAAVALGMGNGGNDDSQYVVYHGNGGQYQGKDTINSTTEVVLSYNLFTRDNYHCVGWNTKADGSGVSYAPYDEVKLGTHLYAQWSDAAQLSTLINAYTDRFNLYLGQAGSSDLVCIDLGGTYEIPTSDALIVVSSVDKNVDVEVSKNKVTFKSKTSTSMTAVTITLSGASIEDFKFLTEGSAYIGFTPNEKNSSVGMTMIVEAR